MIDCRSKKKMEERERERELERETVEKKRREKQVKTQRDDGALEAPNNQHFGVKSKLH